MNRNIGQLEQPKPSRVIEFADGRLGAEYVGTDPRILRFAGRMAITDASIGGDGVAIMRVRDEAQEPGKRNRIAVGNGVMFDEDTGSTLVASGETTAIPDILLGKPYAGGAVNTGSVEAILVEVGRDRFAPTVTVGDVDSPFDHFRQILDGKRAEYEQKQRTEEILKRLPKGFKTSRGSEYRYTPEGHSERWKFDGTHHAPMGIAVFIPNQLVISRMATSNKHVPPDRRVGVYIIETDSSSGAVRKVYDIRQVHDPNNLKVAAINRRDGVIEWQPVSLFPVKDYHVYEMSKLENGDTIRHPGHKVTEIF
jgi:hypothetical protein